MYDDKQNRYRGTGPWEQVSRLGNPLVNEVLIPMAEKDRWNHTAPKNDDKYAKYVDKPELAALLPVLYPGAFPNLAKYGKPRADLNAILLTGIPKGVVPGFQNFTGPVAADMLRLNVAIPPSAQPNNLGLVAGDAAGFPNGRRIDDDVVTIELRAIAGLTLPLVDPSFKPDGAAERRSGRHDQHQRGGDRLVPAPRAPGWRLPDDAGHHEGVVMPAASRRTTGTRARAPCWSTSAATSGPSWSRCRRRWPGSRWRSVRADGSGPAAHTHDHGAGTSRPPPARGRGGPADRRTVRCPAWSTRACREGGTSWWSSATSPRAGTSRRGRRGHHHRLALS